MPRMKDSQLVDLIKIAHQLTDEGIHGAESHPHQSAVYIAAFTTVLQYLIESYDSRDLR